MSDIPAFEDMLYRLALARLNDPAQALTAAARAIAALPAQADDDIRIQAALAQAPRRKSGAPDPLNRYIDGLDDDEHLLLALLYLLDWPAAQAARLLRLPEGPVQSQQRLFRQQLARWLPGAEPRNPDPAIRAALQERWPAPTDEQRLALLEAIQQAQQAAPPGQIPSVRIIPPPRLFSATPRRLIVLGAAAVGLTLALGGAALFAMTVLPASLPPTPQTFSNLPTPVTPAPVLAPLWRNASENDIRQRLNDSPGLWRTLYMAVQHIDYGPPSYSGPPRRYSGQAWISQPGEGIEAWGLLDGPIMQIRLTAGGQQFERDLLNTQSHSQAWDGYTASLLGRAWMSEVVFPSGGEWMIAPGTFSVVQMVDVRERTSMIADWLDIYQVRRYRLWIDAATGLVVRVQHYGGEQGQELLWETVATQLAIDQAAPPPELSAAARQSALPPTPQGLQAIPPTPTLAATPSVRQRLPLDPAPVGFDPSGVRLVFQPSVESAGGPLALAARINDYTQAPTLATDLFGDGYYLGQAQFGLPWGLRCARSPDGLRLAFSSVSEGVAPSDLRLRWLDLREARRVYQPEINLLAESFAFAPDSARLAAFGGGLDLADGIYIINLNSAEISRLMPAQSAHSLAFSPDGEFLAFIGQLSGEDAEALFVVHIRSRAIAFRSDPGTALDAAINQSPILGWGTAFPVETGGMETCAR